MRLSKSTGKVSWISKEVAQNDHCVKLRPASLPEHGNCKHKTYYKKFSVHIQGNFVHNLFATLKQKNQRPCRWIVGLHESTRQTSLRTTILCRLGCWPPHWKHVGTYMILNLGHAVGNEQRIY